MLAGSLNVYLLIFAVSIVCSFLSLKMLLPRLIKFGFFGEDMHKPGKPKVAEMGGIAIVIGFTAGVLLAIAIDTFSGVCTFNPIFVLSALATIYILALIGLIDDLFDIPQWAKAGMPLIAAIPMVAVMAGTTVMNLPFIGAVDFGIFYLIVIVPIGIAVASNLTNMLAGFNGMEVGMGTIIFAGMILLAVQHSQPEMLALYIPMLGALLGFLPMNIYPSRVFPGDIGTLTIGAVLACGVIIGNMESAGALMLLLYVGDFLIKLPNRFPKTFAILKDGKLYAPKKIRGLVDVVLKASGGIGEEKLVRIFLLLQALITLCVVLMFGVINVGKTAILLHTLIF